MRKIIVSNLLLIMFLVGAASGFFVSNIGWWGLHRGAQDLDRLYDSSGAALKQLSDIEAQLQRSQELFLDVLRKQQLSPADKGALVHSDGEVRQQLGKLQHDPKRGDYWAQVSHLYNRVSNSRERVLALLDKDPAGALRMYAVDTASLSNQMFTELHQSLPQIIEASTRSYERGAEFNRDSRLTLLAMSMLATVFFCLTAALTYREARERRRKSAELDREHTLFRTLFEGTTDGVILRSKDRFIDCNRAALKLFAVPNVQAFAEMGLGQLQPMEQPDGALSAAALLEKIEESMLHGSQRFEWLFKSLDGREFPAEVTIDSAHLLDRSIAQLTVHDISRRKQNERSMRLANQAFENSLEGMTITDDKGNILTVNRAFTTITGYSLQEVVGRNPRMLSSGRQSQEFYKEMWEAIGQSGKWQGEIWNIRKNGDIYPQWLNISRVVDDHGRVTNYVGVFSDISERKSAEERILHQVYYDQLTDLPNRVLFSDRLNQVMNQAKRNSDLRFAVMFLDLDRFKLVNDSMGHDAGDQLLQQAAHRLRGSVRSADTVARMGGDEFTIVLSEVRSPKDACSVAQKILDAFRAPFQLDGEEVYVSVSIGISVYPDDGASTDILLKNADMAMYRAKSSGGSWYELYDEGLGTQASQRLAMETALHKAIERNELELHYQPQFDCNTSKLVGFEALLRWRHPERGLLAPEAFLNIAEETGLIVQIGEWVLRTACTQAQAWRKEFPGHRLMAINLSGRQFQSADLARQVSLALQHSGLPHFCLELEITESVVMHDLDASIAIMHQMADLGVQFSIDDFGTGHSSLAYLKKLPLHALKIDSSFIRDIVSDQDDAAIVGAIVAMSNKLGLRVVAEGIEDKAQLDLLKAYKGIVGQGYLMGRPQTAEAISKMIADGRPKSAFA
ncbi:EAL domain-containing protein [Noviherbaspirillum sp. UKPF54]|uniref:EAL domain-containing protein n=1 Tax=Noviherbaspirillum sp. UKPF54 TaxID=2601898 RepID=UPI00143CF7B0|nr:EAL domain-containing protein [Noviherbaspirillum sp. UKPF54]